MNEEKKMQVATTLASLCFREEETTECPMYGFANCPFPEKPCTEVTPEDWREWMEGEE